MNAKLEKYLDMIDKHLRPLPTSERVDIVKEIKGTVIEMENEGLSAEQILERLGDPKDLAKAYLGDLLANGEGFSWTRFLTVCAFYSIVGFSGLFVIPVLGTIAPVFIICGVLTPVFGAVKLVDYFTDSLFNFSIPFAEHIGIYIGGVNIENPFFMFLFSIICGVVLFLIGKGSWKLLVFYCKRVSKTKRNLSI